MKNFIFNRNKIKINQASHYPIWKCNHINIIHFSICLMSSFNTIIAGCIIAHVFASFSTTTCACTSLNIVRKKRFFLCDALFCTFPLFTRHHDNQHNAIQHNYTKNKYIQHNYTKQNDIQHNYTKNNYIQYKYTQHNDIQHYYTVHNDIQYKYTQHNDIQYKYTQRNDIQHNYTEYNS